MTTTQTLKNRTFTTDNGTRCTVWTVKAVERLGFWTGLSNTTRTFVTAEDRTEKLELEPGCSFRAETAARKAGW